VLGIVLADAFPQIGEGRSNCVGIGGIAEGGAVDAVTIKSRHCYERTCLVLHQGV
jgi:hypothetical protein